MFSVSNQAFPENASRPHDRGSFEIAIICALPLEANAVIALLDLCWEDEENIYGRAIGDPNA